MNKEIVYALRYFGSGPGAKPSATKTIWLESDSYHIKYKCEECGYQYHLTVPLDLVEDTKDMDAPVIAIYPDQQTCEHIFGYWDKRPIIFKKFSIAADIETLKERENTRNINP